MRKICLSMIAVFLGALFYCGSVLAQVREEDEKQKLYPDIVKEAQDKLVEGAEIKGEQNFIPENLPGGGTQDYLEEEVSPEFVPQTEDELDEDLEGEEDEVEEEVDALNILGL